MISYKTPKQSKTNNVVLKEVHRSGLTFEKKNSKIGDERIHIHTNDMPYTTVGISQEDLFPLISFLKKVTHKLETMTKKGS